MTSIFNDIIKSEIEKASDATSHSLTSNPLTINHSIHEYLEESSDFFHQGEWQVLRPGRRFLATINVLTCIAVFAWTNKGRKGTSNEDQIIAFGAHLDAEYYHGGQRFHDGNAYVFLCRLMKSAFGNTNPFDIQCYIVGDHSTGSPSANTLNMGSELVDAMTAAGYQVNTHLYKIFPGASVKMWASDPMGTNRSLYQSNQCFFFVAMDCQTGQMLAHTRYVDMFNPCPMWTRNQRRCDLMINGCGSRQFQANKLLLKSSGSFI